MSASKTISLTDKDEQFIAGLLDRGDFGNASEVIRAGLHLLEQRQLELEALRCAIKEGDAAHARGDYKTYTEPGQLAADLKEQLRKRHLAKHG